MKALDIVRGWWPVALKEGRASLVSPRLLIIAAILALAILAATLAIQPGSGGGGQIPERLGYGFTYYPDLNSSRPALALFVARPTGEPVPGVEVQLVNISSSIRGLNYDVLKNQTTNASGWARFEGLAQQYPNKQLGLILTGDASQQLYASVSTSPFSGFPRPLDGQLYSRTLPLGGSQERQVLSLVFMDTEGNPQAGADVFIWSPEIDQGNPSLPPSQQEPSGGWGPYRNGSTDGNGFYLRSEPLGSGFYVVRVAKGDLNATNTFGFSGGGFNPLAAGPDGVLYFVGVSFVPLLLPVMALVLGFDAIARERADGSLDLLLSKPVSRLGVALGKLGGVMGSTTLPVVAVLLAAAGVIWARSGTTPTGAFLATLVGEALFLLLAYAAAFLAFSALVRSPGTALLVSILFFLLFAFFWGLVSFAVASVIAPVGSVAWLQTLVIMSLASPTGVYQQLLGLSIPGGVPGLVGLGGGTGAPVAPSSVAIAAALWAALPVVLFLWAMKYRVTEG